MKIGIDANPLSIPFSCGIKNYTINLIDCLAKIDKKNQYYIFSTTKKLIPKQHNFHFVKIPNIPFLKRQLFLTLYVKKIKVDVLQFMEPYSSMFLTHPKIITVVHDIRLDLTYPIFSLNFFNRIYCEITRFFVFKKTKNFIVPTEFIKSELNKYIFDNKSSSNLIRKIYEGVGNKFSFKKISNDKRTLILCMGDFAPRKNVFRSIDAYNLLSPDIQKDYDLGIVCSDPNSVTKFRNYLSKYPLIGKIRIYEKISDKELIQLYKKAYVFLYPSLYEGFGLPLLEAMKSGVPVITSNIGATKEVAGKAAVLVNPLSVLSIKKGLINVLKNKYTRNNLIRLGLKRVEKFNWMNTAKETLKIYETI